MISTPTEPESPPSQRTGTLWDDARNLTDGQLRDETSRMAIRRGLGKRTRRELAFLDVLHQRHPAMCWCPERYKPHWLHERVNDPYGTPHRHPFWDGVTVTRTGPWKLFERGGTWYGYETRQNAWAHFPGQADAEEHAARPAADVWA